MLSVVNKALAGQKVNAERGKSETDEQLRQRVLNRMDPWWISEHDVESAFRTAVASLENPHAAHDVLQSAAVDKPSKPLARI